MSKKKTYYRALGQDGQYDGILQIEKRSFGSASSPAEMKSWFRHYFDKSRHPVEGTINSYEFIALQIISDHGIEYKKPYNFHDAYVVDGKSYYFIEQKKYKTLRELAEATGYKDMAILIGLIQKLMDNPAWELEALGRAAKILGYCHHLKSAIEVKNIETIVHESMLLQQEIDQLGFMPWEHPAKVGENLILDLRKAAEKSAEQRANKVIPRNEKIIAQYLKGVPSSILAVRFELSTRSIQNIIKPYRK